MKVSKHKVREAESGIVRSDVREPQVQVQRPDILEHQAKRLERRIASLDMRNNALFVQQFVAVLAGVFVVLGLLSLSKIVGVIGILAVIVFIVYAWRKRKKVQEVLQQYNLLVYVKQTQVARLKLDWEHIPTVEDVREEDHPFENDLDISGERSLHRLLSTAVSDGGKERVREWLLNEVPDLDTIHERQRFVQELTPLTRFRDKLQCSSLRVAHYRSKLSEQVLMEWLGRGAIKKPPLYRIIIAFAFTALLIVSVILYVYAIASPLAVVVTLALCLGWSLLTAKDRPALFSNASTIKDILTQLNHVFGFLEKYHYSKQGQLGTYCEPFRVGNTRPSVLMRKLQSIASRARITQDTSGGDVQLGQFLINILVPWDALLAYELAQLQEQARVMLPRWIECWYELEALCSLADFACLNPDYTMPEIIDDDKQPFALSAQKLGHPLIERNHKVVNDVTFENLGELMLITGSNMAGKSTFLRTLGINMCLAYAGAPVNAQRLCLRLFELNCCIRVTDSIADGYSYFYAEVRRLKGILSRLQAGSHYPLFVLVDEIFKGTNNRERLIGSSAYIHALTEYPCCGAISTHDLDLVKLADELPQMTNTHFREEVVRGEMVFDYKLRIGPCPTTNALKILQMEGLPITWKTANVSRE
jgi:ABC-type multidrug transport system fused ATPase/permease subunit